MAKSKRRRAHSGVRRAALAGGVTATATALAIGLAAPSANALTLPIIGEVATPGDAADGITAPLEEYGVNLVTSGPPFGLLALFGVDLGYVPALPGRIEDEVTETQPLTAEQLKALRELLPVPILAKTLRLPVVVGWGPGAMSAGMAYPGIAENLGSLDGVTIMPMLLLRNWGRADGGIAARFSSILDPIAGYLGYDSVVTPEVKNQGDDLVTALTTGFGKAFVPIKIDATVEYDPFSDFAAWPNPVTLANNAAAFAFPTYLIRGGDADALSAQATAALPGIIAGIVDPNGGVNVFLTLPTDRQPMLEPFRYPADFANFVTGGRFNFTNPFADSVEPAIKILGNLGYTNVVQNPAANSGLDPYDRDFSGNYGDGDLGNGPGGVPFGTLPQNVNWDEVPEDVLDALAQGVVESFFFGGIPGVNNPYIHGPTDGVTSGVYRNPLSLIGDLAGLLEGNGSSSLQVPNPAVADAPDVASIPDGAGSSSITVDTAVDEPAQQSPLETGGPTVQKKRGDLPLLKALRGGPGRTGSTTTDASRNAAGKQARDAAKDTRQAVRGAITRTTKRLSDAAERATDRVTGGLKKRNEDDTSAANRDRDKDQDQDSGDQNADKSG